MRVLVSGSHGLIGSALTLFLRDKGVEAVPLDRFLLLQGDVGPFEGFDGVVHLAGKSIVQFRYSKKVKREIWDSRVRGTRLLSEILSKCIAPPKVVVTASGVGYYGNCGNARVTEESPKGSGFIADLAAAWEGATVSLKERGVRVAHARFGSVLSREGGMLGKMIAPYKWWLGGKFGSGEQALSWVDIEDAVRALYFLLTHDHLHGPFNVAAPHPTTQGAFSSLLGQHLHRKTLCNVPAWVVRLVFGEMADELFLSSIAAYPRRLEDEGFAFKYATLEESLKHLL